MRPPTGAHPINSTLRSRTWDSRAIGWYLARQELRTAKKNPQLCASSLITLFIKLSMSETFQTLLNLTGCCTAQLLSLHRCLFFSAAHRQSSFSSLSTWRHPSNKLTDTALALTLTDGSHDMEIKAAAASMAVRHAISRACSGSTFWRVFGQPLAF
jgi:hypothetical protein